MTRSIDPYLERIGWRGPVAADLDTLRGLVARHAAAIPFENLNPFLGLPVELTPEAIERKLVASQRGGYCFEHNLLLMRVLREIGFEVSGLAARVLWGQPEETITARGHMLLRVELGGRTHLVDVGFGGLTLTGALRLEPEVEQPTPHEPFRLIVVDSDWRMQALVQGEWRSLYRFDLQRQYPVDYEVSNYFLSTNPLSQFVIGLRLARAEPGRRLALRNRDLAIHPLNGPTQRRRLETTDELIEVLERDFSLVLPDREQFVRRVQRAGI